MNPNLLLAAKKILIGLIFIILSFGLKAQGCLPEGITFTTQAQIDSFPVNYPGCTEIGGNVIISGSDIINLDSLIYITSIFGDLEIYSNVELNSLLGLTQIIYIGGSLSLFNNGNLTSLNGLNNISFISESLIIRNCHLLVNLSGLGGLNTIRKNFVLDNNDFLINLIGLENLDSIGWSLAIVNNNSILSTAGLNQLFKVGKSLSISDNPVLNNISDLENIDLGSITSIYINRNRSLSECNVQGICNYLSNPNGTINIYGNAHGCNNPSEVANSCGTTISCLPFGNYYFLNQSDIDNFQINHPDCSELSGITVIVGADIINLLGLSQISTVSGTIDIGNTMFGETPLLTNLEGLNNIDSINWHLVITAIPTLTSLSGLDGLTSIGRSLNISGNYALANLSALSNLTDIGQYFNLAANDILENLAGLESLTNIGGEFWIVANNSLSSLAGIDNLSNIAISLVIESNQSLVNLNALENLKFAGSNLTIDDNPSLISLAGIDSISNGELNSIQIIGNSSLSTCEVKSICNYLADPSATVEIYNNASGCNTREEVEAACLVGIDDKAADDICTIFPNPSSDRVSISLTLTEQTPINLVIMNNLGQKIATITNETLPSGTNILFWNANHLPEGIYYYKLQTDYQTVGGKLILMK